jgi:hypothetical protein
VVGRLAAARCNKSRLGVRWTDDWWLRAELEEVGWLVARILVFGRRRSGERRCPVMLLDLESGRRRPELLEEDEDEIGEVKAGATTPFGGSDRSCWRRTK